MPAADVPREPLTILVCDDHALFRAGLRAVLSGLEARFVDTASVDDALAQLAAGLDVGLLLLDLRLPGSEGLSGLRRIRGRHPDVPVVIVSATESPEAIRAALAAGAAGFVPKSSTPEVLRAALQLVLGGGVYVPPAALPGEAGGPGGLASRARAADLTARQLDVLRLLARGLTNREIAGVLGVAEATVKTHVASVLEILDVSNRTEAALVVHELGLDLEDEAV